MNTTKKLSALSVAVLLLAHTAPGASYSDATNDLLPTTASWTHLNIASLDITNDAVNISFTINLVGDPIATSWGEYQVSVDLIPAWGATNGTVPNGRPISMSNGGMDYWVRSWNGGAETYHWDNGGLFWFGDHFTWAPPSDIQVPTKTTSSVTLTTTLASLGLAIGDTFAFDVSTSGGTPTDSAVDSLANPNPTAASGDWVSPYDSGTNVYRYTVTGTPPVLTNDFGAAYSDSTTDLLAATVAETHLNIAAVAITNDTASISFTIYLAGDPIAVDWGQYSIGIDSIASAGATSGTVPPTRPILMSGGMDFWVRSWNAGAEIYHWDSAGPFWALDSATYNPPSTIEFPVKTANSVTLTTTLAALGLSAGESFYFDVFASGGNDGDSAIDALANPNPTFASGNWVAPYDSGARVFQYTVTGAVAPIAPLLNDPQKVGNNFTVTTPTQTGFNYVLEFKNALTDANWTAVQTNSGTGATITMTDSGVTEPNRYYRVRVQ